MKVSIARIRLYLKEGKTLADKSNPIMLMCSFNGRKEISTGYSCIPKYWDKKSECVKKGYPNYVMINHSIQQLKNEAIERRNEYERLGEPYTPQMILSPRKSLSAVTNDLKTLILNYISEKGLKEKTAYNWKYTFNLISEFDNEKVIVNELRLDYVKRFIKWMQVDKKLSDGVIKMILSKVAAICNYAIGKGLMNGDDYPFKEWKYSLKFKTASKLDYIHWKTLDVMKEMLLDDIIVRNGNLWSYRDEVLDKLMDKNSALFARYLFMSMVLWQGLAQVDLCQIRKENIEVKTINNSDYYCWDGKRSKTLKSVKVRIPCHTVYTEVMVKTMLMFNNSEWFLPVLNGLSIETDENLRKHRISNTMFILSPKLKEWFKRVNEEVVRRNVENKSDIPLIDVDKCTYYSSRHAFAMAYMSKGGSPMALATLLGRSASSLAQYIKELSEESDLVEAVSIIV
jgi:hypothetical protein